MLVACSGSVGVDPAGWPGTEAGAADTAGEPADSTTQDASGERPEGGHDAASRDGAHDAAAEASDAHADGHTRDAATDAETDAAGDAKSDATIDATIDAANDAAIEAASDASSETSDGGDAGLDACLLGTCVIGTRQCSGNNVAGCIAGPSGCGEWRTNLVICTNQTCVSGTCQGVCAPAQSQCSSNDVQACNAAGQWGTATPCSGSTPVCLSGACVACSNGLCSDAGD